MKTKKYTFSSNLDINSLATVVLESFSERDWATFQGAFILFVENFKDDLVNLSLFTGLSVNYLVLISEEKGLEKVTVLDLERVLDWFSAKINKDEAA